MTYLRNLNELVLDHRLRRVVESLVANAEEVYAQLGLPFRARWTSTYLLLYEHGPMPIVELADRIGLTHPTIINITNAMADAGLVDQEIDAVDRRRRLVRLTELGEALSPELQRIWRVLTAVQHDRFRKLGCDVIRVLNQFEDELAQRDIAEEVLAGLRTAAAT